MTPHQEILVILTDLGNLANFVIDLTTLRAINCARTMHIKGEYQQRNLQPWLLHFGDFSNDETWYTDNGASSNVTASIGQSIDSQWIPWGQGYFWKLLRFAYLKHMVLDFKHIFTHFYLNQTILFTHLFLLLTFYQ